MSFHVGEDIGDYTITALIGAGSMGRVFQVEHRLTKRKEALKVLSAELATPVQLQRFEREIAIQARLSHPNIATVHNAFSWKGCLVMVIEFLEGQTLEKLLSQGRLPIQTGIEYIRQALAALAYAHDQGVVHRDVTPANLIVTPSGWIKLTDFGVSKSFGDLELTKWGDIVGSLQYMAPEQARGSSHSDRRSDLYAVGAILYEILAGRKPFGESRQLAAMVTDSEADPPLLTEVEPSLPPQWNDVVRKALARDRELRYSSASEFLKAIEQAAGASRSLVRSGSLHQWSFWLTGAGVAAAALLPAMAASLSRFAQVPPPRAITFHIPAPEISQPSAAPLFRQRRHRLKFHCKVPCRRVARHTTISPSNFGSLCAPNQSRKNRTS
jgi:serine/threonine protein kinase